MSDSASGGAGASTRPMPRPPGSVAPRAPRAPDQRGEDLEPPASPARLSRRKLSWTGLKLFLLVIGGCTVKFFFPRTLTEPATTFKVGRLDDFAFGVDDKLQQAHRIWVCRDTQKLYVIRAICTHLGCTPNWVASANKFKCPCHGSGYDSSGVNFEGPAPRPMDRCHVELAPDGQIVVDVLRLYPESRWKEEGAFLTVV
jgi:cytochrome b6-f complex iron-sulfur subunit